MEFHYDGGRENVSRLPKLLMALLGCAGTLVALGLLSTSVRVFGSRSGALILILLASGPVLVSIYLSHLLRHHQYKSTRILLEPDALTIYQGNRGTRVERRDIDYVHHSGSMLEIRLRNRDPILVPAQFTNQDELLRQLGC